MLGKLDGSLLDMIDGTNVGLNEDNFVGILDGIFETITVGKVVGCCDKRLDAMFVGKSLEIDNGIEV